MRRRSAQALTRFKRSLTDISFKNLQRRLQQSEVNSGVVFRRRVNSNP